MSRRVLMVVLVALAAACTGASGDPPPPATTRPAPATTPTSTTAPASEEPTSTTTATIPAPQPATLTGRVTSVDGVPLAHAVVTRGDASAVTFDDGSFTIPDALPGPVKVDRPGWWPATPAWNGSGSVEVALEPVVARALRVTNGMAADDELFEANLDLAARTSVNALVFDSKDETGIVRYDTRVGYAWDIGVVDVQFDMENRLAAAKDAGLYTITRVVTFDDPARAEADPDAKLAGTWIDAMEPANWEYPLALAVEGCELGFDEIQFDYVRFPAGRTADVVRRIRPTTQEERVETIRSFLSEARSRLNPMGCAVAADLFAIVMSTPNDQGIGQRPEDLSEVVDVISPMVYPSHYGPGWLGFADPNDHPGPVTADALDDGAPRLAPGTVMRPWLQAFYYSPAQVREGIDAAGDRGMGWMLWHVRGTYDIEALPPSPGAGRTFEAR